MPFDNDFLQTLKDRTNIVDVIQDYVHLERRGDSWWGCCPFHHEKTPSFSVSETRQFYHCFGCGVSGDAIKFVQEEESVDFMEAVRILADKAKIPVPETNFDPRKSAAEKKKKQTILKVLKDAAHFYLDNLNSGNAKEHIDYILKREIPSAVVRSFGLGASLDAESLPRHLLGKGYTTEDLVDSGAVYETGGQLFDSQAGRLIFPIINTFGEVVGFGGRTLAKPSPGAPYAKYKNTKDTPVFTKRKTIYNINKLKNLKKETAIPQVIMVEGYMDVISLYSAGFRNVVASMGTSLTREQAGIVKRYTTNVLISYDADSAGEDATVRGLDVFRDEGINVRVVKLPEGYDPDDVIKKLGRAEYQKCLDAAVPLIDYKMEIAAKGKDLSTNDGKRRYVEAALKVIKTAETAAEQEELIRTLSKATGITYESLNRDLGKTSPGAKPRPAAAPAPPGGKKADAVTKASRFVVASYLFNAPYVRGDPVGVPYTHEVHRMIARFVKVSKEMFGKNADISELLDMVEENTPEYDELNKVLEYTFGEQLRGEEAEKGFFDCKNQLDIYEMEGRKKQLQALAAAAETLPERQNYLNQITKLDKSIQDVKSGKI
ncbi:MAG: DNA primase [Bacteroidales bacterium]|nr:DNA primase [Bacteroidales bacterium]